MKLHNLNLMIIYIDTEKRIKNIRRGEETKRTFEFMVDCFDDIVADELRSLNLTIEDAEMADLKVNGISIPLET